MIEGFAPTKSINKFVSSIRRFNVDAIRYYWEENRLRRYLVTPSKDYRSVFDLCLLNTHSNYNDKELKKKSGHIPIVCSFPYNPFMIK